MATGRKYVQRGPRLKSTIYYAYLLLVLFVRLGSTWTGQGALKATIIADEAQAILANAGDSDTIFLPAKVRPIHYDLTFEPIPESSVFRGHVDIELAVRITTETIVLHGSGVNVTSASVRSSLMHEQIPSFTIDPDSQTIRFSLLQPLSSGSAATLHIGFVGNIREDYSGLFASPFTRPDGSKGALILTQLAPTSARRAFPCFDEPALKASFSLSLIVDSSWTAIGNMDVNSTKPASVAGVATAKKIVQFNRTPPMSTYLVAFAAGELSYIENSKARVPIRIYASPADDVENAEYAAEIIARGFELYEKAFGLSYPLPKLDLVSAPTFLQGGMENWGIIIAHSTFFPFDEDVDSEDKKERMAELLIHELAHQWFGNIVTLAWWDQLWLNEGGATEMSMYCLQQLEPQWTLSEYRRLSGSSGALAIDGYRSSHAIEVPVSKPDDITQVFDSITYTKGALILKMVRQYLTPDVYFAGISQYLKAHAYSSATTCNLWDALSNASGRDVLLLTDPWTKAVGYPFVRVKEARDSIHLEQHRFLFTGDPKVQEDTTIWPIILGIRTSKGLDNSVLSRRSTAIDSPGRDDDFYILNANYTYPYRTFYPIHRLRKLSRAAKDGLLYPKEQMGLISDTCALAHAGYHKTSTCLELISDLVETEPLPWIEIIEQFHSVMEAWKGDAETIEAVRTRYRDLTAPLSHQVGWDFADGAGHDEQQFKAMMFVEAGMAGDVKVVVAAMEMFERFAAGNELAIPQAIQRGVFQMALLHGGDVQYNVILRYIKNCRSQYNRRMALQSLLVTEDAHLVQRTLDSILSGNLNPSDASLVFGGVRSSVTARNILWEWTRDNWSQLKSYFPDALGIREQLARAATRYLTSRQQLDELRELVASEDIRGLESELELSIEYVRGVVAWVERDTDDLRAWLAPKASIEL